MNEQLSLFPVDIESKNVSISNTDSEAKHAAIQRFLNTGKRETIACVNKYQSHKSMNKYFRLSYRFGRKMKHIHICGGNTSARLANYRANQLQAMIDRGAELSEVLEQLADFNSGNN